MPICILAAIADLETGDQIFTGCESDSFDVVKKEAPSVFLERAPRLIFLPPRKPDKFSRLLSNNDIKNTLITITGARVTMTLHGTLGQNVWCWCFLNFLHFKLTLIGP